LKSIKQLGRGRKAFTIIEVMVSVVLISIVVLAIIKMQQESRNMAIYLSDRSKSELSNTLFLGTEVMRYHKDKKDAYTLIEKNFRISDDKSRKILKETFRDIYISEPLKLAEDEELPIQLNEILLKGDYPARFVHFEVK